VLDIFLEMTNFEVALVGLEDPSLIKLRVKHAKNPKLLGTIINKSGQEIELPQRQPIIGNFAI
jgi:hypothetical protein